MPKILTFSRTYPSYHPRSGEPTYFVEKICAGLADKIPGFKLPEDMPGWNLHEFCIATPKWHTIRDGHRFKVGDRFSPRVWSGTPYRSRMIQFAPDIEVKKVYNIFMDEEGLIFISGKLYAYTSSIAARTILANNDGLELDDFESWFPSGRSFDGQIICCNENVNY